MTPTTFAALVTALSHALVPHVAAQPSQARSELVARSLAALARARSPGEADALVALAELMLRHAHAQRSRGSLRRWQRGAS